MGLETGTYISDLNASNPVGASDPKSQGDDHIRLVKSTILATFPNIAGAMTASHTQLNQLASLAAVSVLGRSANSAGAPAAIAAAANDRILRRVSDVVDFGQLTAGMFPNTVVPDAALSSNVSLYDAAAPTFSGSFLAISNASPHFYLNESDGATDEKIWLSEMVNGTLRLAATAADGSPGSTSNTAISVARSGLTVTEIDMAATLLDFHGAATFDSQVTITNSGAALDARAAAPRMGWYETDEGSDGKGWMLTAIAGQFRLSLTTDSSHPNLSGATTVLAFNRSGVAAAGAVLSTDLEISETLRLPGAISPSSLSGGGTTNNYAPTGHADAAVFRLTSGGAHSITGIAGGVAGRRLTICNIGNNAISLLDDNAGSTAANRIRCTGAGRSIPENGAVDLWYDGTSSRWRVIAYD